MGCTSCTERNKYHYESGSEAPELLCVFGGSSRLGPKALQEAEAYSPKTNEWMPLPPLTRARENLAACAVKGRAYVVGGYDGDGKDLATCEELKVDWENEIVEGKTVKTAQGRWVTRSSLQSPRRDLSCIALNEALYAVGGRSDEQGTLATVEFLDWEKGWLYLPSMITPRHSHATAAVGNVLYAFGGDTNTKSTASAERLDVREGKRWETIKPMDQSRRGFGAVTIDGKIYVFGGSHFDQTADGEKEVYLNTIEVYDPRNNSWTTSTASTTPSPDNVPHIPAPKAFHATVLVSGHVYLTGGLTSLSAFHRFDTHKKVWDTNYLHHAIPDMAAPRSYFGACALPHF